MALLESKGALIEAINADIVNNGKKGITGDTLNLILNSIVELMGTGSGGGGNVYNLPMSVLAAYEDTPYTFTPEEATAFKAAVENWGDTIFGITADDGSTKMKLTMLMVAPEDVGDGSTMYTMVGAVAVGAGTNLVPISFVVTIDASGENVSGYFAA